MRSPFITLFFCFLLLMSCDNTDEITPLDVPNTYSFERNGQTTVAYSGQTDRLNQLSEMKAYFQQGDAGSQLSADVLNAMYSNTNGNGGGSFSFTSEGKQLKDKTFAADVAFFEDLFEQAEAASLAGGDAAEGQPGFLTRTNGNKMLVDANGHEFTQIFEKGIMGSVFLNQIYNVYLTDERIGNEVENTALDGSNNYTKMEHHWDEAFGYFGVPHDFPATTTNRFWGNYSNSRDALLGTNAMLMDAYRTGRAAIVAKRYDVKDSQREVLYKGFELVAASTAIHYLNEAKTALAAGPTKRGDAFHALSEGYMFIKALRLSPYKKLTNESINTILTANILENFWALEETDLSGITTAINTISAAYPELANIKDQL